MLSVLSLNINSQRDRWLGRRELLLAGILQELPDFIFLQDVHVASRQVNWLVRQLNTRWGNQLYHGVQEARPGILGALSGDGIAILSRLPILWHEKVSLGNGNISIITNVELPLGRTLDLVSLRLMPGEYESDGRYQQVMNLLQALTVNGRSEYKLIGGDFNDHPDSRAVRRMKQFYISAFADAHGYEPVATYPTALITPDPYQTSCIDYIFTTNTIDVQSISLFGRNSHPEDNSLFISTHLGLLAKIEFSGLDT